jgi:hypothetical protein
MVGLVISMWWPSITCSPSFMTLLSVLSASSRAITFF